MHALFFCKELFHSFAVHLIRHTAINRADSSALWLLVKALALSALRGNDIIRIHSNGGVALCSVHNCTVNQGKTSFHIRAIGDGPFNAAFIDGIVGAFRFAGATVDAFFCNLYSHNISLLLSDLVLRQNYSAEMNLQERKDSLARLGKYMSSDAQDWQIAKQRAMAENAWFTQEFIELAVANVATNFLAEEVLQKLILDYSVPSENIAPNKVGIVMAGNIPLVGFHDLVCTFLSGHYAVVKLSSKDTVLTKFLIQKVIEWNADAKTYFSFGEMLKGCDAYIATGSNNSSKYFEYYFSKYPHIIRKSRTSVAILTGEETEKDLEDLADDVYQYFGLGCRNVTKIFVPQDYDFRPLLKAFKKYNYLADHPKYKNNYDYNLALHLLNKRQYMSNESLLLVEDASLFSPISQLNYGHYKDRKALREMLLKHDSIQCVVSSEDTNFGEAQCPGFCEFADNVDTLKFLLSLNDKKNYESLSK